ncbi:uncharacterized protein LOC116849092 [Odontomachus brunneus]|uniref:uncharacterized protein LOC116849092 n=1 Tax=Odontomachus brunneus TaxID=486640 RepID=UPI0013F25F25|nr:uncharacterized protein LOC116849092 [Odontomachus brunneus]
MQGARALLTCVQIYRYISSSSVNCTFSREGRFMMKIMQKGNKSKKKWYDHSTSFHNPMELSKSARSPSNHTVRRMTIRNKLFMEHITDQISMGAASNIINGTIEITHVEITPDFTRVNVFWNPTSDTPISQEALQKCGWIIRHELSQLRVIGVVPLIQFVENKKNLTQNEIKKRFVAIESDIKDFEILSYSEQMELATSHIDQASHEDSIISNDSESEPDIKLPVMRQDVLGLDHSKIMTQITISMFKSRTATQRRMLDMDSNTDKNPCDVVSDQVAEFLTKSEQRELFRDFLKKRQLEEKRKYRARQPRNQQLDYSEEEMDCEEEDNNNKYDFEDEHMTAYDDFEHKR